MKPMMMMNMMTGIRRYSIFCALFTSQSFAFQVLPEGKSSAYEKKILTSQGEETVSLPLVIPGDDLQYTPLIQCPHAESTNDVLRPRSASSVGVLSTSLRARYYIENIVDTKPITLPLSSIGVTTKLIPPRRNATARTYVGLDNMPAEYWYDNRIHTFGNSGGPWGGVHALLAPLATRIIDDAAYKGVNARDIVSRELQSYYFDQPNMCILDLCCGVGMSTRALSHSFKDAQYVLGIDTSPEMLSMARFISKYQKVLRILKSFHVRKNFITDFIKMVVEIQIALTSERQNGSNIVYSRGNAERVNVPAKTFDLVTIMYAFHEIPYAARYRILREARRLLKEGGILAVIDIHDEEYKPSGTMLAGEPYVLEYQENICDQLDSIQGFVDKKVKNLIPGHVKMWVMTRQK